MFLYDLAGAPGRSLYDRLTGCIRRDILEGRLPAGSRLPSKRCAAAAWGISVVTVVAAYDQLLAEGYLVSEQRRGYYVAQVEQWEMHPASAVPPSLGIADCPVPEQTEQPDDVIDLIQNRVPPDLFPLSVWNRLSRRVWREEGQALLRRTDYNGLPALRGAIRDSLYESRGIRAEAEDILVSAGNEQLYATLLTFLGRKNVFGVEDPGYPLIARLYGQNGARVVPLPLDAAGVTPDALETAGVNILHISPNRVIYVNTFSKTVAPSLRIGYAVLPPDVSRAYRERLGFLSCPVSVPEQYILAAFMTDGSLARHISRMRTRCRGVRDALLAALAASPLAERYTVSAADGGLHFLLHLRTTLSDIALCAALAERGVRVRSLRDYYAVPPAADTHTLVISYAGLSADCVQELVRRLDTV